jgi:hypothetical protein
MAALDVALKFSKKPADHPDWEGDGNEPAL